MATTFNTKVDILVGLPGSGKTTFANSLKNRDSKLQVLDYDKCDSRFIKEKLSKILSANMISDKRYPHRTFKYVIDGLFLTKQSVYDLIDAFEKAGAFAGQNTCCITLHIWNINREACLHNDKLRNREQDSAITIKNATIDIPSKNEILEKYKGLTKINVIEHEIEKWTELSIFKKEHNIKDDNILSSLCWSLGGTLGNCWNDELIPIGASEPVNFDEFDEFISKFAPNIPYLKYKQLHKNVVKFDSWTSSDYYGGKETYARYTANIEEIINYLKENNLLEVEI